MSFIHPMFHLRPKPSPPASVGLVTPGPQAVREEFYKRLRADGSVAATDWFYHLCRANDYIRTRRIEENIRYCAQTEAGGLEITINLSKPEKDPRDIALARLTPAQRGQFLERDGSPMASW